MILFCNVTAPSELYSLSLHTALPIWSGAQRRCVLRSDLVPPSPAVFSLFLLVPPLMQLASPLVMVPSLLVLSWALPLLAYETGRRLPRLRAVPARARMAGATAGRAGLLRWLGRRRRGRRRCRIGFTQLGRGTVRCAGDLDRLGHCAAFFRWHCRLCRHTCRVGITLHRLRVIFGGRRRLARRAAHQREQQRARHDQPCVPFHCNHQRSLHLHAPLARNIHWE